MLEHHHLVQNTDGLHTWEDSLDDSDKIGTLEQKHIQPPEANKTRKWVKFLVLESPKIDKGAEEELQDLVEARESGIPMPRQSQGLV